MAKLETLYPFWVVKSQLTYYYVFKGFNYGASDESEL